MSNRATEAALRYHNATKHSPESIRKDTHTLDWPNQPLPFKIYPDLEAISLQRDLPQTEVAALSAISQVRVAPAQDTTPALYDLSRILYFSAGITKARRYSGGEFYFRAAACTGALYEIELYVVCGDLPNLDAGIYHFGPADFGLRPLRKGDFRGNLVRATANEPAVAHASATIICTGTYWRNAWKYQARTYRHFVWDNGTLLANMLAVSVASGLPSEVALGFLDAEVNRLLDVDGRREVSLCLVPVGHVAAPAPPPRDVEPLKFATVPLSKSEVEYPAMLQMHDASSLQTQEEVREWRSQTLETPRTTDDGIKLQPLDEDQLPRDTIEQVILRRGSTRRFDKNEAISFAQLSTILDRSTRGIPADFLSSPGAHMNDIYLIAHAVEGLEAGAYAFHREQDSLELLKAGKFRAQAYHLGLGQELPADACADIFFLADLSRILGRFGNRGYRTVQLEAGINGGKMYLASYALGLGATGLTFFDDDVVNFFSPHAAGKSAIFLIAIGKPVKRR